MPNPLSVEKFSGELFWFCKTLFIIWTKSTLTGVGRNLIIKYGVPTLNIQQKIRRNIRYLCSKCVFLHNQCAYFQTKHQKNENDYIFTFSNVQSSTCTCHASITAPWSQEAFTGPQRFILELS
jgi:hypothetical protein